MLRLWIAIAISLFFLFALLSAVFIIIGSTQPPNPTLAGLSLCGSESVCWYGIEVNVTTREEADRILNDVGYERQNPSLYLSPDGSQLCDTTIYAQNPATPGIISSIFLTNCPSIQLGDALISPVQTVWRNCSNQYLLASEQGMIVFIQLYPASLHDPINRMSLGSILIPTLNWQAAEWQGFVPNWRRTYPSCPSGSYDPVP